METIESYKTCEKRADYMLILKCGLFEKNYFIVGFSHFRKWAVLNRPYSLSLSLIILYHASTSKQITENTKSTWRE